MASSAISRSRSGSTRGCGLLGGHFGGTASYRRKSRSDGWMTEAPTQGGLVDVLLVGELEDRLREVGVLGLGQQFGGGGLDVGQTRFAASSRRIVAPTVARALLSSSWPVLSALRSPLRSASRSARCRRAYARRCRAAWRELAVAGARAEDVGGARRECTRRCPGRWCARPRRGIALVGVAGGDGVGRGGRRRAGERVVALVAGVRAVLDGGDELVDLERDRVDLVGTGRVEPPCTVSSRARLMIFET